MNKKASWKYVMCMCFVGFLLTSCSKNTVVQNVTIPTPDMKPEGSAILRVWYGEENEKAFLEHAADGFKKKYGISVKLYKKSLSKMQDEIIASKKGPDVYLISNDRIGRAIAAGNGAMNSSEHIYNSEYFSETALSSITYLDEMYGYPVSGETSVMVYNADIVTGSVTTFQDVLGFADAYEDSEESSREILKWDVNDEFINYSFVGAYAQWLGENGDNKENFDMSDENMAKSLAFYQKLSQYFSIDAKKTSIQTVAEAFRNNKLIFMLAKTGDLHLIQDLKIPYTIGKIPDIDKNLKTRSIASTEVAMVNPNTAYPNGSHLFAHFLAVDMQEEVLSLTGKLPVLKAVKLEEEWNVCRDAYDRSKSMPKLLSFGEQWLAFDLLFENIWSGEDIAEQLSVFRALDEVTE